MRFAFLFAFVAVALVATPEAHAQGEGYRGPSRINFDERLIKGQTTKAGSVYIFDRQQSEIASLVKKVRKFRQKVITSVFEE